MANNGLRLSTTSLAQRREHLTALQTLEESGWSNSQSPAVEVTKRNFAERFDPDNVVIALIGSAVVGYAAMGVRTGLPANSHVRVLRSILISPENRGQGVGTILLQEVEQLAITAGARKIGLTVLHTNLAARHFYRKRGYKQEGRLRGEFLINGDFVDDLILGKQLL